MACNNFNNLAKRSFYFFEAPILDKNETSIFYNQYNRTQLFVFITA
jgi:hypothetical protein